MTKAPQPHRDQETISSFKRTINAAILILAAREPPPGTSKLKITGTVVLAALAGHFLGTPVGHLVGQ